MVCLCRKWVEEEGRRDYNIDKEGEWGGMGTIMEVNLEKMRKREGEGNCAQILKLGRYGRKHYEER